MTDFWMLDAFTARHPPADLIAASYFGVKGAKETDGRPRIREAARGNRQAVDSLPPMRNLRTMEQMPEFVRGPEMLKVMEGMKAEWQTNSA